MKLKPRDFFTYWIGAGRRITGNAVHPKASVSGGVLGIGERQPKVSGF